MKYDDMAEERGYVYNTWEQVGTGGVYIACKGIETGVGARGARCVVHRNGFKADPNGHWIDDGGKVFYGKRAEALPLAQEWAAKKFGIKEWRRNGMGDYVDATKAYMKLLCEVQPR